MEAQQNFQKYEEELEINLIDYVRVIWRRKKSILAIFVAVIIAAVIINFALPKIYESSALVEIGKFGNTLIETPDNVSDFLAEPSTFKALAQKLALPEDRWFILKKTIKVKPIDKLVHISAQGEQPQLAQKILVRISAQAKQPQLAKKIVEAVVDLLKERHQQMLFTEQAAQKEEIQFLNDDIQATENRITEMEIELSKLKHPKTEIEALMAQGYISALSSERERLFNLKQEYQSKYKLSETKFKSPAVEPIAPIKPNKKQNIIIGAILGLFISLSYAFLAEYFAKNK